MKVKQLTMSPLLKKAEAAMKAAIRHVLLEHKQKGLPIVVWQNNKMVHIPSRRIPTR